MPEPATPARAWQAGLASGSYDSFVTAPEELPISDARDHLADVLGRATYAGQITYITKRRRAEPRS